MTRPSISRSLLAPVIVIALFVNSPAVKNALAQTDVTILAPGATIERELKAGETHSYRIALVAGQFLHLRVETWNIQTPIKMFDPDNRQLFSDGIDLLDAKRIFVLAERAGEYRLEVGAADEDGSQGRYAVKVVALEAATPDDKSRLAAQQLEAEAGQLVNQQTPESLREALGKYQEALRLWESLSDQEGEGKTLQNIGTASYYLGEKRQAFDSFNQALARLRAAGDRAAQAQALNDLGVANIGELQDALSYYEQALALRRAILRERLIVSSPAEGILVYHIGMVYRDLGEYQKALDNLRQSLSLWGARLDGRAYSFYAVGDVYARLGEAQQALDYYGQALSLWRQEENDPKTVGAGKKIVSQHATEMLIYIGAVYASISQWQQALENYDEALKRARAEKFGEVEARTLNKMGAAYLSLGDYQKALDCLNQSLLFFQKEGDRGREADALRGIGEAHRLAGEPQKSLGYFEQALALQRAVGDQVGGAATAYAIARARRDLGQLDEARAQIEAALDEIESLRNRITSYELRASYLASKQDYYEFYIDLLMRMDARRPAEGYAALALQASERARARSLLETLSEARENIRQGVDPKLIERETTLRQQLNVKSERLTRLLSTSHKEAQAAAKKELDDLLTEYREVEGQIRTSSPRYAALTQPAPLSLERIQKEVLDDETLLLEYSLGEEKSFLWAVTPTSIRSFELPKRGEIEAAARRVYEKLSARNLSVANETPERKHLRVEKADAEYPQAAAVLSQMLLGPIASQLGSKRLLIVGEGALQYVPVGALPVPTAQGRGEGGARGRDETTVPSVTASPSQRAAFVPLIAEHEIVNLPSASVLSVLRREMLKRQPPPKTLAVLADPVFSSDDPRFGDARAPGRGDTAKANGGGSPQAPSDVTRSANESGIEEFARLQFTRHEADAISSLVPDGQKLEALDFNAELATVRGTDRGRTNLGQYRFIHFATHGLINSQHPELSGVVLSLVDKQGRAQDGFLRLYEIYNLNLNADLVVLSACQTALGKEIRGEGLIGLTRGFMYAGAPRVVASLWRIDDRATAELMRRFYQGIIRDGLRPAAAFRAAQVSMWKDKRWAAPHYWAAFTLQGEWK